MVENYFPIILCKNMIYYSLKINIVRMKKPLIDKNITQPDDFFYQVRIVRRGVERSRSFYFKQWGSKAKALTAAINWRDKIKTTFKANTKRRLKAPLDSKSVPEIGVSRIVKFDKRRSKYYLSYAACWTDTQGKGRIRAFSLGDVDLVSDKMELAAHREAVNFRRDWERHADNDTIRQFEAQELVRMHRVPA